MQLLLLGGGHAHAGALLAFAKSPPGAQVKLVSPAPVHTYSGMVPGVIAGHYAPEEAQIDLARLCGRAGAELIVGSVAAIDAAARRVRLADGRELPYDFASLNLGSLPATATPGSAQYAAGAKPFEHFFSQWEAARAAVRRVAVVGGGAAGVEMAMAVRHRVPAAEVVLYSDRRMFEGRVEARVEAALERCGVQLRRDMAVTAVEPGPTVVTAAAWRRVDFVLWVAGAASPPLLAASGLATDAGGFALVDTSLRSVSHAEVFAAGDCASILGHAHPKSGVYAVRHAPVLAANLKAALRGHTLREYAPQRRQLALLSCGGKYAIASRGRWSAEGAWCWRWKDWLDRRWLARFR